MKNREKITPRVKLHENGNVTVSGVPYRDMRSILTEAHLHRYEHEFKDEPEEGPYADVIRGNNAASREWEKRQFWLLKQLDDALTAEIKATHPSGPPPTVKERLREITRNRAVIRELVNKAIERRRQQQQ